MPSVKFGLFGAGGFGREVMPYVRTSVARTLGVSGTDVEVYFVETAEPARDEVNGYPLISLDRFLRMRGRLFFNVAVGSGRDRETMVLQVGTAAQVLPVHAPGDLLGQQLNWHRVDLLSKQHGHFKRNNRSLFPGEYILVCRA